MKNKLEKYLTETSGPYTTKELGFIDAAAPTISIQVSDYHGNRTKYLGLNDKAAVKAFMKFLKDREKSV